MNEAPKKLVAFCIGCSRRRDTGLLQCGSTNWSRDKWRHSFNCWRRRWMFNHCSHLWVIILQPETIQINSHNETSDVFTVTDRHVWGLPLWRTAVNLYFACCQDDMMSCNLNYETQTSTRRGSWQSYNFQLTPEQLNKHFQRQTSNAARALQGWKANIDILFQSIVQKQHWLINLHPIHVGLYIVWLSSLSLFYVQNRCSLHASEYSFDVCTHHM